MKKNKLASTAMILMVMITQAQASEFYSYEHKITCKIKDSEKIFATFYENVPSAGFVTMKSSTGNQVKLKFTKDLQKEERGCFVTESISKTYMNPYYEFQLVGKMTYGKSSTRCAGSEILQFSYTGTYFAEMQKPVELSCFDELSELK